LDLIMKWQKRIREAGSPGRDPVYDYRATAGVDGVRWTLDLVQSGTWWVVECRDPQGSLRRRRKYPNLAMALRQTEAFVNKKQQQKEAGTS
jgi:hypothetical protein